MAIGRRVVIVGIASHWGAELARRLERDPSVEYLAGVDTVPPPVELRADGPDRGGHPRPRPVSTPARDQRRHGGPLRDPLVPGARQARTHPARRERDRHAPAPGRLPAHRDPGARRGPGLGGDLRLRGTVPELLHRADGGRLPLRTRFQRDISELEGYFENFARRHPHLVCCMLRYQPEIGPDLDMPLVRYLSLPVVPTQLGFDPRLQLLHADDADRGARGRRPQSGARGGQRRSRRGRSR